MQPKFISCNWKYQGGADCKANEQRGIRDGRALEEGARETHNTVLHTLHEYVIVATLTH